MAIATRALNRLRPAAVTIAIASSNEGKARTTSMRRMSPLSAQPVTNPAIAPIAVPMTIAKVTAPSPTVSDVRAP